MFPLLCVKVYVLWFIEWLIHMYYIRENADFFFLEWRMQAVNFTPFKEAKKSFKGLKKKK